MSSIGKKVAQEVNRLNLVSYCEARRLLAALGIELARMNLQSGALRCHHVEVAKLCPLFQVKFPGSMFASTTIGRTYALSAKVVWATSLAASLRSSC